MSVYLDLQRRRTHIHCTARYHVRSAFPRRKANSVFKASIKCRCCADSADPYTGTTSHGEQARPMRSKILMITQKPCTKSAASMSMKLSKQSKLLMSLSNVRQFIVLRDILSCRSAAWKRSPIAERQAIFRKAAALLRERSQEYALIEQGETTSGAGMANFEMGLAIDKRVVCPSFRFQLTSQQLGGNCRCYQLPTRRDCQHGRSTRSH